MGQCLRCVHNVDSLKEQVLETFNDLEFDEVFFCLLRDALQKKKRKKKGTLSARGGGGSTPVPFLSPNLPDSQITQKWTFDTTI